MHLYPDTAEEKLGFDVLRERIASFMLSSLGQDRLDALRPTHDLMAVREELDRVGELQGALRFDDAVPFASVLDVRGLLRQAQPEGAVLGTEDLVDLYRVLVTVRRLHSYFKLRQANYPTLWEVARQLIPVPDLEKRIDEVIDEQGVIRDNASPELRRIRRQIIQQQQALRSAVMRALRSAVGQGYTTEEQPTIRNGRMVIPVRVEAKRKIQGFIHDTSATGQTVYIEPASALDLNNEVRTLELEERHEIRRIMQSLTDEVRQHLGAMRQNLERLGQLDLLQAKARLSNQLDAVVPPLVEEPVVHIRSGRHPLLALRFEEDRTVVPLDLSLGDSYRTLVITGPNAGGKSVAMKTVGLFALMLAYGLPVPVEVGSSFGLFEHLFVDVGDEQSIEDDLSTFSSHAANLRYMLAHATAESLILIDEAGTGTDPDEGSALAQAALERLNAIEARTIVTTHHGSLKAFAHATEGVENASMQFDQATLQPTYQFRAGVPGSSYAFEVASRMGVGDEVLARARGLVGEQKAALEELIAAFEAQTQGLERERDEAEQEVRRLRQARSRFEEADRRIRGEEEEIRTKALTEAERIVQQANARVERTIREIKEAEAEKEATRRARQKLDTFREGVAEERKEAEQRTTDRKRQVTRPSRREGKKSTKKSKQPSVQPASGPIQVGDQVVLDGGTTAAEVVELDPKEAVIATGALHMRVALNRLTKVGGRRPQQVSVRQTAGVQDLPALTARPELDVRGKRVDEALAEVDRFVSDGLASGLEQATIIHGKGTGALRQAIQEVLRANPDIKRVEEADWRQGGAGATVIQYR